MGVEWTVIAQRYTGPATSRNVYGTVPTDADDVNALPDRSPSRPSDPGLNRPRSLTVRGRVVLGLIVEMRERGRS